MAVNFLWIPEPEDTVYDAYHCPPRKSESSGTETPKCTIENGSLFDGEEDQDNPVSKIYQVPSGLPFKGKLKTRRVNMNSLTSHVKLLLPFSLRCKLDVVTM